MNISRHPVSKITAQYLEYLHKLEELDVDVSADLLYGGYVIYIKSKMCLPPDPWPAGRRPKAIRGRSGPTG